MMVIFESGKRVSTAMLNDNIERYKQEGTPRCALCKSELRWKDECSTGKRGWELQCGCASTPEEKEYAKKNQVKVVARKISREEEAMRMMQVVGKNLSEQLRGTAVETGGKHGQDITIRRGGNDIGIWVYWSGREGVKTLCDWLFKVIERENEQMKEKNRQNEYCEPPSMLAVFLDSETKKNGLYMGHRGSLAGLIKRGFPLFALDENGNLFELMPSEKTVNKHVGFSLRLIRSLSNVSSEPIEHPKPKTKKLKGKEKIGHFIVKKL